MNDDIDKWLKYYIVIARMHLFAHISCNLSIRLISRSCATEKIIKTILLTITVKLDTWQLINVMHSATKNKNFHKTLKDKDTEIEQIIDLVSVSNV